MNEISDGQIEIEALLGHFNLVLISRSFVIQLLSLGINIVFQRNYFNLTVISLYKKVTRFGGKNVIRSQN